jgi:molecular chaperone GrpE
VTPDDRNTENGDGERVVVRDRRRIDPVTGDVRPPAGVSPAGGATPGSTEEEAVPVTETDLDPRVEELAAEVAERTADLQRVSAEYANYRRRVDRDREAIAVTARAQVVSELLTVLDDLDRAEAHGDLTGPFKSVADKLVAVVQKQGLEPFGEVGEEFDPAVHEAVQHEQGDAAGPTVTVVSTVMRRGYRVADRVLRPAMVAVVDRTAGTGDDQTEPPPGE